MSIASVAAQQNSALAATNAATASSGTTATKSTGSAALNSLSANFGDFLKLLMTQLQNQDPTSPLDTNQFTTELVQFSSVEQQINTNTSLTQNVSEWRIAYRKKTPASFVGTTGGMPGMPIGGSMPIGGGMPAGGSMPIGGGPSVGPAGGMGAPAIGTPTMSTPPGVQQTQYVPAAGMGLGAQPAPGVVPPVGPVGGPISPVGGGGHTTGWGP